MNPILRQFLLISSIYLLAPSAGALSLSDALSGDTRTLAPATETSGEAAQLLEQLEEQLGITKAQAAGGTGALLQLARSELGGDSISTLTSQASGLSALMGAENSVANSLLSGISSMSGVESAFSALGMDSAMVSRFVPIIMSFLGDQGVGSSLLGQLQGLWTTEA